MEEKEPKEAMISPYRALDLADETGLLCGKILGDLGADVIKIEKPGGDAARRLGPFYYDEAEPEKSLFWLAFNNNKRGITLDIETADGREIFQRLVKSADWVIETFPPGYLDKLGLGYAVLEKLNPGIILVSITPFGQTGPWKDYKAPDIVALAVGGAMYPWGHTDSPPVRISHHSHAHLHAGAQAAVGAMMALHYRQITGEGQWVNVSIQAAVVRSAPHITHWDMQKVNLRRGLPGTGGSSLRQRETWPCKDGFVKWTFLGGGPAPRTAAQIPIIQWMDSEGMTSNFLKEFDWGTFDLSKTTQEVVDRMEAPIAEFFLSHTKAEIYAEASKRSIRLYPLSTTKDLLEDTQLAARKFWVKLEHPELDTSITYPGAFAQPSETAPRISRRAPLIGEHNQEIYEQELGISKEELVILKQAKVI